MDGQQQFVKPAQHVPFYVRRPITLDTSPHPHIFGYENGQGKPASYSVDLSHARLSKPKRTDQLSEPMSKSHSKSLRDVFEKAILSGDVPIHSPDEGVIRNPSFITTSLQRPEKFQKEKEKSATISGDNYVHLGKSHHRSTDYFMDSDSESDVDTGRHNDAYFNDASSTISDEMFKSNSEGPGENHLEEFPHLQPLPQVLDLEDHQAGRSTLGGLFKPKYNRDYPHNNVHRTSERLHKEVIDSGANRPSSKRGSIPHKDDILHRDGASLSHGSKPDYGRDVGKLPRTRFPVPGQGREDYASQRKEGSHSPEISHNQYLPKKRKSSRSPRTLSPRLNSRRETAFNEIDGIVPASPDLPRRSFRNPRRTSGDGRVTADGQPLEQLEMEDPPWVKAEIRERRRRRRRCLFIWGLVTLVLLALAGTGVGIYFAVNTSPTNTTSPPDGVSDEKPTTLAPLNTTASTNVPPTTPQTQNITLTFGGTMRITNEVFSDDYRSLQSERSMNLSGRFCNAMEDVFNNKPKQDYSYQDCNVTGFSRGSVIVKFSIEFRTAANKTVLSPQNASQPDIPPTFDVAKQSDTIVEAIKDELENSTTGLEWVVDNINITYSYREEDDNDVSSFEDNDDDSVSDTKDEEADGDDDSDDDDDEDSDSDERQDQQHERSVPLTTRRKTILNTSPKTTSDATTARTTLAPSRSTSTTATSLPQLTTITISNSLVSPSTTTVPTTTDSSDEVTTTYTVASRSDRPPLPEEWADFEIRSFENSCRNLYYKTGDRSDAVPCWDNGFAISLKKLPVFLNRSMCTIPINLPLNASQALNSEANCSAHRQYLRYDCPETVPVHDVYLLMPDFEYVIDCCGEGEYFDKNENKCADCEDSCPEPDESEDQNSEDQNGGICC